jgi:hypothetical protein
MDFKKFLIPLIFLLGLSCPPNNLAHRIYDSKTEKFIESYGGINEDYLNLTDRKLTYDEINLLQWIDKRERQLKFVQLEKYEAAGSQGITLLNAKWNMQLIKKIDEIPLDKLDDYHRPLKKLLMILNKEYSNENLQVSEKFERMYSHISNKIHRGKITMTSSSIENLINDSEGDCNDLAPAYFALLNYYGVPCYMRFGKIIENEEERGYHAWITVETEKGEITLDPMGYPFFVPLDERNENIEKIFLKEEAMIYKIK